MTIFKVIGSDNQFGSPVPLGKSIENLVSYGRYSAYLSLVFTLMILSSSMNGFNARSLLSLLSCFFDLKVFYYSVKAFFCMSLIILFSVSIISSFDSLPDFSYFPIYNSHQDENLVSSNCYCQYTKMGSNNNAILDRLSIVDKYVQITTNKLHLFK